MRVLFTMVSSDKNGVRDPVLILWLKHVVGNMGVVKMGALKVRNKEICLT